MVPTDDKYRMVEDELLRVAQQFTTHLHRAEYTRLKEMTRLRNARTIREIERPVVQGRAATLAARWRKEVGVRDERQRARGWGAPLVRTSLRGLMLMEKRDDDDDDDGDEGRIGLGFGSRARARARARGGDARTRAAAGCSSRAALRPGGMGETSGPRRPGGEEESSAGREAETETQTQTQTETGTGTETGTETETVDGFWSTGKRRVAGYGGDVEDDERGHDDDDDGDDDPFGVNRRRERRRIQSREQMRVDKGKGEEGVMQAPDTIPSFL